MTRHNNVDVLVVGAGFAGLYAVYMFRDRMRLNVRAVERGADVGGTWYWNRYPGARCDVESMFYSYSFDSDLEQDWEWSERYPTQPEILRYANHVADRFDLRRSISFGVSVVAARFDDGDDHWVVETDQGEVITTRYLVTAVGCLSAGNIPEFPGRDSFVGDILHTGGWPQGGYDFTGKRVAVIGTGSSGTQAIPEIAKTAQHLTVFQRTPHFVLPAGNRPLAEGEADAVKADYRSFRTICRTLPSGTPIEAPLGSVFDFERDQVLAELQRRWDAGGTNLMTAFTDTSIDLAANDVLADFIRDRIAEIVDDPATAAALTPHDYPVGAKRIVLGTDYYATYNRENVDLVDVRTTPIERIDPGGIVADGVLHEADVIVFATGYDGMTGALTRLGVVGTDGVSLAEHWRDGPKAYLGIAAHRFPNLFMLTGPGSPSVLTNVIVSIEQHVEWLARLVEFAGERGYTRIEADQEAQESWAQTVGAIAEQTLFVRADSWYLGANVPGKPRVFMPYAAGIKAFSDACDDVADAGFRGFSFSEHAYPTSVPA